MSRGPPPRGGSSGSAVQSRLRAHAPGEARRGCFEAQGFAPGPPPARRHPSEPRHGPRPAGMSARASRSTGRRSGSTRTWWKPTSTEQRSWSGRGESPRRRQTSRRRSESIRTTRRLGRASIACVEAPRTPIHAGRTERSGSGYGGRHPAMIRPLPVGLRERRKTYSRSRPPVPFQTITLRCTRLPNRSQ